MTILHKRYRIVNERTRGERGYGIRERNCEIILEMMNQLGDMTQSGSNHILISRGSIIISSVCERETADCEKKGVRRGLDGEYLDKFFADATALATDEGAGVCEETTGVVEVLLRVLNVSFGSGLYSITGRDSGPSGGNGCFKLCLTMLRMMEEFAGGRDVALGEGK